MLYSDIYKYSRTKPKFRGSKIKKAAMKTGLYSFDEVTNLIVNENYIPVATAAELDALRNAVSQTMGAGTAWEGTYTTGLDKKYVQVGDINLSSYPSWDMLVFGTNGGYDGNRLLMIGFVGEYLISTNPSFPHRGFFTVGTSTSFLKNVVFSAELPAIGTTVIYSGFCMQNVGIIDNCSVNVNIENTVSSVNPTGGFCATNEGEIKNSEFTGTVKRNGEVSCFGRNESTGIIDNCHSDATVEGVENVGGFCSRNRGTITNSSSTGTVIHSGEIGGGFVGTHTDATALIEYCNSSASVQCTRTTGNAQCGGFVGRPQAGSIIRKSYATGNVNSNRPYAGGFCSLTNTDSGVIENCYATGDVYANGTNAGGFTGLVRSNITNCYSTGAVTSSSATNIGGFAGQFTAGAITNCYYDTNTSGRSDTGKGLPRTTPQMQQGTADSFILPAGGVDGTSDPANAMYTAWDGTIWKFTPLNAYPTLR